MSELRTPYVGSGIDGALRSAAIDDSEADGLDSIDPRRSEVLDSARRWREQAELIRQLQDGPVADELTAAALRYDTDTEFRALVDGTAVQPDEVDWDAVQAACEGGASPTQAE